MVGALQLALELLARFQDKADVVLDCFMVELVSEGGEQPICVAYLEKLLEGGRIPFDLTHAFQKECRNLNRLHKPL